ncbi:MFS transporter [Umezawaea tangerina]|uniref:Putative MFS family arabinose efflux permease n=1 Tax=Umezawaea tangerina TaxID=84725 RepID=A0A2T0SZU3_9PSEU|nr:MFS transporter [Umezawaea tangerina]PRY38914.1 putative MFS family arabinose efflux permease [Umezawaea tangerina]
MTGVGRLWRASIGSDVFTDGPRRRLAIGSFVDSLGSGLFLPVMVLFFTRSAGLDVATVGLGLTCGGIASVAMTPLAGRVLDRYDPRLVLVASYALRTAVYLAYPLVHSVGVFVPLVCLDRISSQAARSARTMVVAGMAGEEDRIRMLSGLNAIRNLAVGIGNLGATAAIVVDSRAAYLAVVWANAVSYVVGALLVRTLPADGHHVEAGTSDRGADRRVLRDRRFLLLAALNAVFLAGNSALLVGVPVWLTTRTSAPAALVGLLFALNTVLIVLLQVGLGRMARTLGGAGRAYLFSGVALLVGCAMFVLAAAGGTAVAVLCMVVGVVGLTIAEIFSSAAGWSVPLALAPDGRRGRYLSVFAIGEGFMTFAGPAVVTLIVVGSEWSGWIGLGVAAAVAGVAARSLCRTRATAPVAGG